mmetsp:Transcript_150763/g.366136  ORF Transcript_150763/g.366136 Transcript_150763/m.366136 type:complete len:319 (-) Transcript_150763:128-1084(-)
MSLWPSFEAESSDLAASPVLSLAGLSFSSDLAPASSLASTFASAFPSSASTAPPSDAAPSALPSLANLANLSASLKGFIRSFSRFRKCSVVSLLAFCCISLNLFRSVWRSLIVVWYFLKSASTLFASLLDLSTWASTAFTAATSFGPSLTDSAKGASPCPSFGATSFSAAASFSAAGAFSAPVSSPAAASFSGSASFSGDAGSGASPPASSDACPSSGAAGGSSSALSSASSSAPGGGACPSFGADSGSAAASLSAASSRAGQGSVARRRGKPSRRPCPPSGASGGSSAAASLSAASSGAGSGASTSLSREAWGSSRS